MENNKTTTTVGPSISTLLGITFIVLKLCKVITWSWVWVLAPFWITVALYLVILIVCFIIALLTH